MAGDAHQIGKIEEGEGRIAEIRKVFILRHGLCIIPAIILIFN